MSRLTLTERPRSSAASFGSQFENLRTGRSRARCSTISTAMNATTDRRANSEAMATDADFRYHSLPPSIRAQPDFRLVLNRRLP